MINVKHAASNAPEHEHKSGPLFGKGQIVATPRALELIEKHDVDAAKLFSRHVHGDWGDLCREDQRESFDFEGRRRKTAYTAIKRLRCYALLTFRLSNQVLARELGANTLMNIIYEVQTQRVALWINDFLVNCHLYQFHLLTKPSKRARSRL